MKELKGSVIRDHINQELEIEIATLKKNGVDPKLAVVMVGEDPASAVYVRQKKTACEKMGVLSIEKKLDKDATHQQVMQEIRELNEDNSVHGILCQLPLPAQCNQLEITSSIAPEKDVDCINPYNQGLLALGSQTLLPCTPEAVLQILKRNKIETSGKNVVIIGRSNTVGRPLSILLSQKGWDATVTLCHSRTKDLAKISREADILVAAIGRAGFVDKSFVSEKSVVIDVGINYVEDSNHPKGGHLMGDVDFEQIKSDVAAITPVPGGVGPVTIAMLISNTIAAAKLSNF